nr:hypothetical protein [Amylibacter sp.]
MAEFGGWNIRNWVTLGKFIRFFVLKQSGCGLRAFMVVRENGWETSVLVIPVVLSFSWGLVEKYLARATCPWVRDCRFRADKGV